MAFAIGSSVQTMAAEEALTTEEAGAMNEAIRDLLELCQRAVHGDKGCRIAVYGSAATGLAARGSDVDTVFVGTLRDTSMTGDDVREFLANKSAALGRKPVKRHRTYAAPLPMRWIAMQLRSKTNKFPFKILEEIGFARVPILKLQYEPTGLELDLSFNSVLSVHNSRMIRLYMLCDPGARPHQLTTFVKSWAKARGIKDSSFNTISSYAYTLLVIFFLQQRGILPNLQASGLIAAFERWRGKELPTIDVNGFAVRYCGDDLFVRSLMEARVASNRYCHESLGSLVVGFFEYYTRVFDWERYAVSIRLGRPRPRHSWPDSVHNRMGIEDPFENDRDLCITIGGRDQRYPGQIRMLNEMVRAREMLQSGLVGVPDGACDEAVAATMKRLLAKPDPKSFQRSTARKGRK